MDTLVGILREGGLWSDPQRIARNVTSTNIGHVHVKQRRLNRPVTTRTGGKLGDYAPFNFCRRSVMLHVVSQGHDDYKGGQGDIVHLVSRVSIATSLGRAKLEYIRDGLRDLLDQVRTLEILSVSLL